MPPWTSWWLGIGGACPSSLTEHLLNKLWPVSLQLLQRDTMCSLCLLWGTISISMAWRVWMTPDFKRPTTMYMIMTHWTLIGTLWLGTTIIMVTCQLRLNTANTWSDGEPFIQIYYYFFVIVRFLFCNISSQEFPQLLLSTLIHYPGNNHHHRHHYDWHSATLRQLWPWFPWQAARWTWRCWGGL